MRPIRATLATAGMLLAAGCSLFQEPPPAQPAPRPVPDEAPRDSARIATRDSAAAAASARAEEARRRAEAQARARAAEGARARAEAEARARERARAEARAAEAEARTAEERRLATDEERRAAAERARRVRESPPGPPPLPGSVLPRQRIVAFYGHAGSRNMGILGELPPDEMLARLDREVEAWEQADPSTPVRPALHVIATMAAADPGPDSLYVVRMPDRLMDRVLEWAERRDALVFLDIQPGRSTVAAELPRLERWLRLPHVHLGLDPEWAMGPDGVPGRAIGSMRAADVNVAVDFLADLVAEHGLPPKVLVVHRFTQHMLPDPESIRLDPRVQLVVHMDGWGPPAQKINTYRSIVAPEVPQFAGFKLFFKNDRRGGSRMLTPAEVLALDPMPFYIQYQ